MEAAAQPPDPDYLATHYGLAVSLARRYAGRAHWAESQEDLTQVALLGLVRAIDRFDPTRGVPFSAFATASIVGELKHYLRDRSWAIRPPRRVQNLYLRSQEAVGDLTQEMGREPTPAEIGDRLDASVADVAEAMGAGEFRRPASLDASLSAEGGEGSRPLLARLPVDDPKLAAVDERLAVRGWLKRLPAREGQMVRLRYLDGLTQHQIAERMGLSQAHVQRLLARSIDHLRVLAQAS
ncbi:MAG TPA: sigma-70 family RNA polymerase sigma factor [Acidimicrobiales bacterium]|nr:sigma-70 family RNA polymerase sigma factor [Acidimicrobiales bacterium]